MELALKSAAKRDRVSIASKAVELLRLALDIEEDFALSTIARKRDAHGVKFLAHNKIWGN
jgi:hypothetical protein